MSQNLNTESARDTQPDAGKHWIYFSAIVLIGMATAMLVPALSSQPLHPQAAYIATFLAALSFAAIWWYRRRSIWFGAGAGTLLGILLFVLAVLVSNWV